MSKRWFRLDTAALIFPAIMRRDWCNVFRLSATLKDEIDPSLLGKAVADIENRFPTFFVSLHRGAFWYYLEHNKTLPKVRTDFCYPLTFMGRREVAKNALRVLYYGNRIAVEFFHAVTDGRGGTVFLSTLLARYTELRYGIRVTPNEVVRDIGEMPRQDEAEDSFFQYSADISASRKESTAYRLKGEKEAFGFKHILTGITESEKLVNLSHEYGVSVTVFLTAVMIQCIIEMQREKVSHIRRQKPVKITLPVDLRRIFPSQTLRNFTLVLNLGIDPRFGEYSLYELCKVISHQMYASAIPQTMSGLIAANVSPQRNTVLRLAPVFLKNLVMDFVYRDIGERKGCLNISNLGVLTLPDEMKPYVRRVEFIIGTQRSYPNNCSVISCNGVTAINMIRNIKQPELERRFFSALVSLGLPMTLECNGQTEKKS